ncbi:MAG: hypothetical protein M1827_001428 [Pycnora praestabilis]|nr:MAG: hypothetical protein M1827_001428 [Pycnora praestabilis]
MDMFNLPYTKRVRREDLYSPTSSPEPSPADSSFVERWKSRMRESHGATTEALTDNAKGDQNDNDKGDDHGVDCTNGNCSKNFTKVDNDADDGLAFDFRLFSKRPTDALVGAGGFSSTPPKIILRSPSPVLGSPSFVNAERPDGYYFAAKASAAARRDFENAALRGEDVVRMGRTRWVRSPVRGIGSEMTGCSLPWRVITIKTTNRQRSQPDLHSEALNPHTRRRPGKKRRIILRKATVAKNQRREQINQSKAQSEAAEREKRTRRNREKKVKRKVKEKEKKMGLGVGGSCKGIVMQEGGMEGG